jgi:LPS-assembly lipoprotein
MSWFNRSFALALLGAVAAASIAGCGFRPLYGNHATGSSRDDFLLIEIATIDDREGQLLRNELIRRLHAGGNRQVPAYRLETRLSESKTVLAVQKNAFATRSNLAMVAKFSLRDVRTGAVAFDSSSKVTVSYNILDSEFASLLAEKNARERGVRELSEDMRVRLGVFFDQQRRDRS